MNEMMMEIQEWRTVILGLHIVGVALGLGGATITDFLFFRSLKDRKVSDDEQHLLEGMSVVIWVGIAVLVVTGIALFLPQRDALLISAKFIAKMCAVAVIVVNGFLLNVFVSPKMQKMDFTFKSNAADKSLRVAFSLGAISATSWYSALVLAFLPRVLPVGTWTLALAYGGIVIAAVIGGQIMYLLAKRVAKAV